MNRHVVRLTGATVLLAALPLLASGCILIATEDHRPLSQQPTLGRQLTDLKTARDNGALNDDEYKAARAKLLDQCKKN